MARYKKKQKFNDSYEKTDPSKRIVADFESIIMPLDYEQREPMLINNKNGSRL